jgi:hypothetical protein
MKKQAYAEPEEDEDADSLDDFVVDDEDNENELLADSSESKSVDELELVDVMQVKFNPKDTNTFASASLDQSIKVWGLGPHTPHCGPAVVPVTIVFRNPAIPSKSSRISRNIRPLFQQRPMPTDFLVVT